MTLDWIEATPTTIRYHMSMTDDWQVGGRIDYDSGDHSAQYRFEAVSPLVLTAERGSSVATMTTEVLIAINEPANYRDSRFNYLSAPLCSLVPLTVSYMLASGGRFDEDTFDGEFHYDQSWSIDLSAYRETW